MLGAGGFLVCLTLGGRTNTFRRMQELETTKTVIGMLHLPALPGSPGFGGDRFGGNLAALGEAVLRDAEVLVAGGVRTLMLENFGDVPFYPGRVPVGVAAHMTAIAIAVRSRFDVSLGINVLRNDGLTALAVAQASGAGFIRVNVLCGARVADQGLLQGIAHDLLRERANLKAEKIRILADVDVKHSAGLAARSIADETEDTIYRGLADAVIVSGTGTGKPTDVAKVRAVKAAAGKTAVFVGSGVTSETLGSFLPYADGFIVGTAFKEGGVATAAVDPDRVSAFMRRVI
jgi:membrane complex biogenesis BtpA family protein